MTKYLPKAERMFQQKLKMALAPDWALHDFLTGDDIQALPRDEVTEMEFKVFYRDWGVTGFDFNYVAELFQQYAGYLQLCEDDNDVSAPVDAGAGSGTDSGLQGGEVVSEGPDNHLQSQ